MRNDSGTGANEGEKPGKVASVDSQSRQSAILDEVERKMLALAREVKAYTQGAGDEQAVAREVRAKLQTILSLDTLAERSPEYAAAVEYVRGALGKDDLTWEALLMWLFTHPLGKLVTDTDFAGQSRSWVDEWLLRKIINGALRDSGADDKAASWGVLLANTLITQQRCMIDYARQPRPAYRLLEAWLRDEDARNLLQVNRYQNALWYNKESFDRLLGLVLLATIADVASRPGHKPREADEEIKAYYGVVRALRDAQAESEYRVEKLLAAARGEAPAPAGEG